MQGLPYFVLYLGNGDLQLVIQNILNHNYLIPCQLTF